MKNLFLDKFLCGFEFEFFVCYNIYETEIKKTEKILLKLQKYFKNVFFTEDNTTVHNSKNFKLTFDKSIKNKETKFFVPLELITPVDTVQNNFKIIDDVFSFFQKNKCLTNETTGFHVNLSFLDKNLNKKIDPLKLIFLSNDIYLHKKWPRDEKKLKEYYFKTLVDPNIFIIEKILFEKIKSKNIFDYHYFFKNFPENFIFILNSKKYKNNEKLWLTKKQSINLKKLYDFNYVEFRILGGKNYHLKKEEIKNHIIEFCKLLEKSIKKNNDKKVIKKIYKLLYKIYNFNNEINNIQNNKILKLLEKYDYVFANDLEFKYLTLQWILSVKTKEIEKINETFNIIKNKKFKNLIFFPNTITNFFKLIFKEFDICFDNYTKNISFIKNTQITKNN